MEEKEAKEKDGITPRSMKLRRIEEKLNRAKQQHRNQEERKDVILKTYVSLALHSKRYETRLK